MTIDKVQRQHDIGNNQTKFYKSPDLVEGYWADSIHADLPQPTAHSAAWDGRTAWLAKLDAHNVIPSRQFYDLINTVSGNLNW